MTADSIEQQIASRFVPRGRNDGHWRVIAWPQQAGESDEGGRGNLTAHRWLKRSNANFNRLLPASCLAVAMTVIGTSLPGRSRRARPTKEGVAICPHTDN